MNDLAVRDDHKDGVFGDILFSGVFVDIANVVNRPADGCQLTNRKVGILPSVF